MNRFSFRGYFGNLLCARGSLGTWREAWTHLVTTFCFTIPFDRPHPAMVRALRVSQRGGARADGVLETPDGSQHLLLVPRRRLYKRPLRRPGTRLDGHRPLDYSGWFVLFAPGCSAAEWDGNDPQVDHLPFDRSNSQLDGWGLQEDRRPAARAQRGTGAVGGPTQGVGKALGA